MPFASVMVESKPASPFTSGIRFSTDRNTTDCQRTLEMLPQSHDGIARICEPVKVCRRAKLFGKSWSKQGESMGSGLDNLISASPA